MTSAASMFARTPTMPSFESNGVSSLSASSRRVDKSDSERAALSLVSVYSILSIFARFFLFDVSMTANAMQQPTTARQHISAHVIITPRFLNRKPPTFSSVSFESFFLFFISKTLSAIFKLLYKKTPAHHTKSARHYIIYKTGMFVKLPISFYVYQVHL